MEWFSDIDTGAGKGLISAAAGYVCQVGDAASRSSSALCQMMYLWIELACVPRDRRHAGKRGTLVPILSQGRAAQVPPWTGSLVPEPGM
jgi:hypothetical protein